MTSIITRQSKINAPTIHQFDNGLTIIAEQMPVEAVNLNVWINVGSVKESNEINGMAHFLEHMVFKGTSNLAIGQFEQLIEERGAVTNAATSQDYTHYYITTAPQDFATLAPLQLDVLLNPSIENQAFEREKLVVLEEIRRSEDSPLRRAFRRSMETCFESLPYRRPVLGPAEVISNLRSQQMRDFHSAWYQPQSMTAAVVGNLPVTQLIDIVTQSYEQNCNQGQQQQKNRVPAVTPEPPFTEIVRREYNDDTLQQARLIMVWRVPGMETTEQTYALDILSVILGQGKVSRLFRELREDKGLVTHVGASNLTQTHQGAFYISAALPESNIDEVEQAIVQQIRKLQAEPIAAKDINRIRTQVANRFIFANERPSDRANLYGYYYSQLQDLAPALNYPERIQSISAADLQAAAKKYLDPEAYGIVVMKPTSK